MSPDAVTNNIPKRVIKSQSVHELLRIDSDEWLTLCYSSWKRETQSLSWSPLGAIPSTSQARQKQDQFSSHYFCSWFAVGGHVSKHRWRMSSAWVDSAGWLHRIQHRKWRETKLQSSSWPGLALIVCSLVCLHFQCWFLCRHPVESAPTTVQWCPIVLVLLRHTTPMAFLICWPHIRRVQWRCVICPSKWSNPCREARLISLYENHYTTYDHWGKQQWDNGQKRPDTEHKFSSVGNLLATVSHYFLPYTRFKETKNWFRPAASLSCSVCTYLPVLIGCQYRQKSCSVSCLLCPLGCDARESSAGSGKSCSR